jgi:hypothetical protein
MTILVLNKLWLDRFDTGESIAGASGRDRGTSVAVSGEVRTYANGRRRAITAVGARGSVTRRMVQLDYATKEKLISWLGANMQMRDHRGNKWFGVFFAVEITEYMRPDLYAASITLETTTTVEGV